MQQSSKWANTSLDDPASKQERDYALSLRVGESIPAQLPVCKQGSKEEYAFHISLTFKTIFKTRIFLTLEPGSSTQY